MPAYVQLSLRTLRRASVAAALAALAACAASSHRAGKSAEVEVPVSDQGTADATYDWHVLLSTPFGGALKEVPLALHEVLLFRDEAHSRARTDEPECYASDTPGPRFVAREPQEYLLCFKQDRLARIQASVRLPPAKAREIFAAACALWSHNAASQNAGQQNADACEGQDGAVHYTGHLEEEQESVEDILSVILDAAADGQ